jgi:hypothetical protein
LFVSATPQAKPEWFSPKVKTFVGITATTACLIVAGIYYIERQKINKFLNNPQALKKLFLKREIQNSKKLEEELKAAMEKIKKEYQVAMCRWLIGAIPCAVLTGIGVSEWWRSYNGYNLKDGIPEIFKIEKAGDGYYVEIGLEKGDIKDRIEYFVTEKNFNKLLAHYKKHGDDLKEVVTNKEVIKMTNGFANFITRIFKIIPGAIDKVKRNKSLNEEEKMSLIAFKELADRKAGGSYRAMVDGFAKSISSTENDKKLLEPFSEKDFKTESNM